ncbi:MAG: hypothetical protein ACRDUT_07470, partial [Mycobacterium sp.]
AVLETAALPVELRPFAGRQANLRMPGPTRRARPPFGNREPTDSALVMENPEVRVYIGAGIGY